MILIRLPIECKNLYKPYNLYIKISVNDYMYCFIFLLNILLNIKDCRRIEKDMQKNTLFTEQCRVLNEYCPSKKIFC